MSKAKKEKNTFVTFNFYILGSLGILCNSLDFYSNFKLIIIYYITSMKCIENETPLRNLKK